MVNTLRRTILIFSKGGAIGLLCYFLSLNQGSAQDISHFVSKDAQSPLFGRISIRGLSISSLNKLDSSNLTDEEWSSFFRVTVEGYDRPIVGSYTIENQEMTFAPRFLPDPSVSYSISFLSQSLRTLLPEFANSEDFTRTTRFDAISRETNSVVEIFPKSDLIPANILRLYVHFANSVDLQNPYDYIHLENDRGERISEPFVEMEEGLWSTDRRRLTLLIHPGRIKRNVGPNMTMGKVFEEGQSYSLVISERWNLKKDYRKKFEISKAIRTAIDPSTWHVTSPRPGTLDDLIIVTNKLLDKALSERLISVNDQNKSVIEGDFKYDSETLRLIFTPQNQWTEASYMVQIDPKLEDVCGNTPLAAFDVEGERQNRDKKKIEILFDVEF